MASAITKAWRSMTFKPNEQWGFTLMLRYAVQIDNAESVKAELLEVLDEADTASKTWWARLERMEKYVNAESTINKTGPQLLDLMVKFGMTPAIAKTEMKGGTTNAGPQIDPVEDELARLRAERSGATARSS